MADQVLVGWANRRDIDGHQAAVLTDEMMRQRHIEYGLA
jgi:hypothetical protein